MKEVGGVVLGRRGNRLRVLAEDEIIEASLRGRLKHTHDDTRVVAGDRVTVEVHPGGAAVISGVTPRRSMLSRRAGDARWAKPVAANIDQVLIVAAIRDPEPNPRMLDRLFVIAEADDLPVHLAVNKIDLGTEWLEQLEDRYRPAGYAVFGVSAKEGTRIGVLRDLLVGKDSVFTGASGVGKTSILNAIEPGLGLRTREVSAYWGTGRHATVAAELIPIEGGGYVIDTPGLREVALWNVDPKQLDRCFPEFSAYIGQCRFADCRHLKEPGCAVRGVAAVGEIGADRLLSYERLLAEALAAARPWE